ncbi:MAG: hypothetical protein J6126_06180 [Clostridia bacterium]|nr:hypothetical protein [Clostridia bacterium]
MDRVDLLKNRRAELLESGKEIRAKIASVIDEESFVELSAYSFSKNEFYGENAEGEGVVTGFATIEGNPVYVVAQNGKVLSGGVSKAACDKICKTLSAAMNNGTPVVYFLDTKGVQIGEGVAVLEGIADVLYRVSDLGGNVPQFAIVDGDCFGAFSLIAAACDFTFLTKDACVSYASPAVIAASAKAPMAKAEVGGIKSIAKTGIAQFTVEDLGEVKQKIASLLDVLPDTGASVIDCEDDLNRTAPALNEKVCADCLIESVFDEGTAIEIGKDYASDVACVLGRIGGISVGAVVFKGDDKGVELTQENVGKINDFCYFLDDHDLPLINFVNAKGISTDIKVAHSGVLGDVANLIFNLRNMRKISVVYGKAVGLAYSVFAAKEMNYDYTFAFCNAKISLFDTIEGAYVEFEGVKYDNEAAFAAKYADENQDPINAAKGGYIDNIIEPQFVRQYLIASLQTFVR